MDRSRPFADVTDEPLLNIKAVSQATGIEPVTLRAWERRYGVPEPHRSEQGYRLFSERDIAILRWLKAKVDAGVTIKRAVAMLYTQNPQAAPPTARLARVADEGSSSLDTRVVQLLDAAHRFETAEAQQIITQAFALFPVEDVCLHLLLPALAAIGVRWRTGEASLQVEHFLTNLIRQQLLALDATMPPPSRHSTLVTGCAPGDWHEMAVLMLSVFLRRQGWEVVYLGQAVGLAQLEETLKTIRPDGVILSSSSFESVGGLREAAELVLQANSGGILFAFGGALFPHVPRLAERIPGVYVGDTLLEAVHRIEEWLTGPTRTTQQVPAPLSQEASLAFGAIRRTLPLLADQLAGLLLDADPTLEPSQAGGTAIEIMSGLQAALQLELPELLDVPQPFRGPMLGERGVPLEAVRVAFEEMAGADVAAILEPYLARL